MPVIMNTNRLLAWAAGLFSFYWSMGLLIEPRLFSTIVSSCMFVGGAMVAARTVPDAFKIIKNDQLGPGELAVIAVSLIATGAVWSGLANMIYAYNGRPQDWIGPTMAFGRGMIAIGFGVLFLSPETTRQAIKWPRWWFFLTTAIIIAAISFLIGYAVSPGR